MSERPIIFLDVDGVLWTGDHAGRLHDEGKSTFKVLDPDCVRRFNDLCKSLDARVVVSSTWRFSGNVFMELHERGVRCRFAGITPDLTRKSPGGSLHVAVERGVEIAEWLNREDLKGAPFVILDDDRDMGELSGRLVQTDYMKGLTDEDCHRALKILAARGVSVVKPTTTPRPAPEGGDDAAD